MNFYQANKISIFALWLVLITNICLMLFSPLAMAQGLSHVSTWGIQLQNIDIQQICENNTIDLIVIDYSATGGPEAVFSRQQIEQIKASGKIVLCYLSIGEAETYRWYWQNSWDANHDGQPDPRAPDWLGPANPDWLDNYKVRYWDPDWQAIIFQYLDTIISQGFDGIYMDIVDAYYYWGFMVGEIPDAASRMIAFIQAIDAYTHLHAPQPFYIFAQNAEAITDESDVSSAESEAYFSAIDGIGCEGLFFRGDADENNPYDPDNYRLNLLDTRYRAHGELILSIEYLTKSAKIDKYLTVVQPHGYLPYVSTRPLDTLFDGIDIYNSNQVAISGTVTYQNSGIPVPDAAIHLTGDVDSLLNSQADGVFQFTGLPANGNFILSARKSGDISNATILSFDASLAARIALGLFPEATQTQMLAADADQNGEVQTYDAALISREAVGLPPTSDSHTAEWLFLPSSREYFSLADDIINADFQGIVIGDVDGNWGPAGNLPKSSTIARIETEATSQNEVVFKFKNDIYEPLFSCDLTLSINAEILKFKRAEVSAANNFHLAINETGNSILKLGIFGSEPLVYANEPFLKIYFQTRNAQKQEESGVQVLNYFLNNIEVTHSEITFVDRSGKEKISNFVLYQNYPNPFNPSTTIRYLLPKPQKVKLWIFNLAGEKIVELVNEFQSPGKKSIEWNGCDASGNPVAAGVYFYALEAGEFKASRKMTLLR